LTPHGFLLDVVLRGPLLFLLVSRKLLVEVVSLGPHCGLVGAVWNSRISSGGGVVMMGTTGITTLHAH
jgi:hypothetical protein